MATSTESPPPQLSVLQFSCKTYNFNIGIGSALVEWARINEGLAGTLAIYLLVK